MGFFPFQPQTLPLSGGTISGSLAVTGTLTAPQLNGIWEPADNGLLAATGTLDAAGGATAALTAGTVYLQKLQCRTAFTITNIWYVTNTAGSGASTGSFVGLYSSAGTLLSGSADTGANLVAAAGAFSTALTSAQAVAAGSFVWLAFLVNLATTQPAMRQLSLSAFATANVNLIAATARSATDGTLQTTLPASFTPSANVLSGVTIWMGVS